jgi:serine/threonine protein kinase
VSRDIKGANLLCTTKGRIKVADFGCSTWFEGGRSVKALTNSGSRSNGDALLGSIPWMAPEALRQERSGRKSDVWSLGCVVVEMATGHRPWAHVSHPLTLLYHVATTSSHPEFPASLSPLARCGVAVVRWWRWRPSRVVASSSSPSLCVCRDFLCQCFAAAPEERWSAEELLTHEFVQV